MAIRALVFDADGTLYDVQSVRSLATELCGDKGELVTQLRRLKQLEYTWLRGLMRDYQDFWPVTRAALDYALLAAGVTPTPEICEPLMRKYLTLELYPEATAALDALGGYKLAILSNGSPMMLDRLAQASGIADRFTDIISVYRAKSFKPDPACYALIETALDVAREEVLFVSSNGFDVAGAKQFGFEVARIERAAGVPAPTGSAVGPTEFFWLMRGYAEQLGPAADHTVTRLTDLAPLLDRISR